MIFYTNIICFGLYRRHFLNPVSKRLRGHWSRSVTKLLFSFSVFPIVLMPELLTIVNKSMSFGTVAANMRSANAAFFKI